jgi:hypothetical protein
MKLINKLKKLFSNPAAIYLKETLKVMSEDSLKIFAEALGAKLLNTNSRAIIVFKITKIISRI